MKTTFQIQQAVNAVSVLLKPLSPKETVTITQDELAILVEAAEQYLEDRSDES